MLNAFDSENYACVDGTLKCPGSYCIDIEHICNNVMDCPNGEDEHGCGKRFYE